MDFFVHHLLNSHFFWKKLGLVQRHESTLFKPDNKILAIALGFVDLRVDVSKI